MQNIFKINQAGDVVYSDGSIMLREDFVSISGQQPEEVQQSLISRLNRHLDAARREYVYSSILGQSLNTNLWDFAD